MLTDITVVFRVVVMDRAGAKVEKKYGTTVKYLGRNETFVWSDVFKAPGARGTDIELTAKGPNCKETKFPVLVGLGDER